MMNLVGLRGIVQDYLYTFLQDAKNAILQLQLAPGIIGFDATATFDVTGPGFVGIGSKAATTATSVSPQNMAKPGALSAFAVVFTGDALNVGGQTVRFFVTVDAIVVASTAPIPTTAGTHTASIPSFAAAQLNGSYGSNSLVDIKYVFSAPLTAVLTDIRAAVQ